MIERAAFPRLSPRARLRVDRRTGGHLLVYPEKALELSPTAVDIVRLCTGELSVGEIAGRLAQQYGAGSAAGAAEEVERDVVAFLEQLADRALVALEAGAAGPKTG